MIMFLIYFLLIRIRMHMLLTDSNCVAKVTFLLTMSRWTINVFYYFFIIYIDERHLDEVNKYEYCTDEFNFSAAYLF